MIRTCVLTVIAVLAASGCKSSDKAKPAAASGSAGSGSAGSAGSANITGSAGSAAAATPEMRAFCIRSMEQMRKCFDDEAFWDAHATTFFAAQKQAVDADSKKQWIGNYKDAFATLVRNKELEQNCDTMLAENQLPTQKQIDLVDQARSSCAAFGGALGYVIFSEGAFYKSREGAAAVPDKLELLPSPTP